MKTPLTLILICISTACFSQDYIVTRTGDSITGRIQYERHDSLFMGRVLDGDTLVRAFSYKEIRSFQWTFPHEVYLDKTNYELNEAVPETWKTVSVRNTYLRDNRRIAKINLLLSPVPVAIGGGIGIGLWSSAYRDYMYSTVKHPASVESTLQKRNAAIALFSIGAVITTILIARGLVFLHRSRNIK